MSRYMLIVLLATGMAIFLTPVWNAVVGYFQKKGEKQ